MKAVDFSRRSLVGKARSMFLIATGLLTGTLPGRAASPHPRVARARYLFVWTGDASRRASDFLAVLDADPASKTYGHIIASVPVGVPGTVPHHTEYEFPADGMLLANGWAGNRTFLIDLRKPTAPSVAAAFGPVAGYGFAHSFARLPDGHVLATFQGTADRYAPTGGLVEMDERGRAIRSASAAGPGVADSMVWPYSLAVDPARHLAVTTMHAMPIPAWLVPGKGSWTKARADAITTTQVQVWRLPELKLLRTLALPAEAAPRQSAFPPNHTPDEPRFLPDGSAYVTTMSCGLYRLTGIAGAEPRADLVHVFPMGQGQMCGVPVIVGHFWIQTVTALPGLVALDISRPAAPVEVSRIVFDSTLAMPHWIAADPARSRVVVTGINSGLVEIVDVDPRTGALTLDPRFRDERTGASGVSLSGRGWPQGSIGEAVVHGTLFGPK
jgi:hypothetical protein